MSAISSPTPTSVLRRSVSTAGASDATLMALVAGGDGDAFAELHRRHGRRAHMHARRLGAPEQLAEEVTQDAFLCLWRGADSYQPGLGSVSTWLARIVRNRAVDAWRRAASRPTEVQADAEELAPLRTTVADELDVDRDALLAVLAKLPSDQREAVFLSYYAGLTHAEIATRLDVPLGTVKGRIRLGVGKLRDGLGGHEPEPTRRRHLRLVPDDAPATAVALTAALAGAGERSAA